MSALKDTTALQKLEDLEKLTIPHLKEFAKSFQLENYEKLKKAELIQLIRDYINKGESADADSKEVATKGTSSKKPEKKTSSKKQTSKKTSTSKKTIKNKIEDSDAKSENKLVLKADQNQDSNVQLPPGVRDIRELDSGDIGTGIFEQMDGFGFLRSDNYMPGDDDIYIPPTLIRNYGIRTGDIVEGSIRVRNGEKFAALFDVTKINGRPASESPSRPRFENLIPTFPDERIRLERADGKLSMRIIDLVSPIGKGQRGMIVSPPKAGKTTLIKDIALSITENHQEIHLIILLIDERPEEVTDIKDTFEDKNVEVIYSTFDEQPERHKKVADMVINRAKRLVEQGLDVCILLDSITRLSRANNLVVPQSGRTLSGGLDPAALYAPKKFFGAARNVRDGGSLTILATALVETGSRMDEVIFEEFKGTGNMELVLDRKLSEKRIFPAIDLLRSSTRKDSLLLSGEEYDTMDMVRRSVSVLKPDEAGEAIIEVFKHTKTNKDFIAVAQKKFARY